MAEAVRLVAGVARLDAEAAADAAPEQEVADERLAADEDLVRQDVPLAVPVRVGNDEEVDGSSLSRWVGSIE